MRTSKRVLKYAKEHFTEVQHTTLNPEGPGVVRIHLVPPRLEEKSVAASIVILNGQYVIPVNVTWSILLTELIREINSYSGREVSDADVEAIIAATCKAMKKVYPFIPKQWFRRDVYRMMTTFRQIAYGEDVTEEIGYVSLGDYAPNMKAPHRMDLMVSAMTRRGKWHCNLQCVHCYAAGQTQSSEEELSTETWKKIIDHCREVGIPQVTFTGGEPTMREDLPELLTYAKWFITRLNTNGVKLSPEYCEELKKSSLDSVQITFYSDKEEIHNKLVGAEGYRSTVKGLRNALAAGLNVSVNTPLCTENRDYLSTLAFLHEEGVLYVTCSGLITTGNAAKESSVNLQLTNAEIREILRSAVDYCDKHGMEISFTSPGWVDDDFCKELGINTPNCGACLSNMAITPGGNVVPCQSWLSDKPLGNFLSDDWSDIWDGAVCAERRKFSAAMRCECPLRIAREEACNEN